MLGFFAWAFASAVKAKVAMKQAMSVMSMVQLFDFTG